MIGHESHSHVPISRFGPTMGCYTPLSGTAYSTRLKRITLLAVNFQFHDHKYLIVWNSSIAMDMARLRTYPNMLTLILRNNLWSPSVHSYQTEIVSGRGNCRSSLSPTADHQLSPSILDRSFNEMVCIDHLYLNDVNLLHVMDTATNFFIARVFGSTSLADTVVAFQSC